MWKVEEFVCGSVADIVNDNNDQNDSKQVSVSAKKRKKVNDFNVIVKQTKGKKVKIEKTEAIDSEISKIADFNGSERSNNSYQIESNEKNGNNEKNESSGDQTNENATKKSGRKRKHQKKQLSVNEPKEKKERTVFVGNLPIHVTARELKPMFRDFGEIQSIRLRGAAPLKHNVPKKVAIITKQIHAGKDSIHAYIVFKTKEAAVKSLELNGKELEGHCIRVDMTLNKYNRDQTKSIFLGNLPFTVKEDELRKYFEKCGSIENVRVVRDSRTGIGKGFGFITFSSKDSVELSLCKHEQTFNGRQLRVLRATIVPNKEKPKKKKQKPKRIPKPEQTNEVKERSIEVKEKSNEVKIKSESTNEYQGEVSKKVVNKSKRLNKKKKMMKKQKTVSEILSV